jgi:thiamine biosynthesis lipoprotein
MPAGERIRHAEHVMGTVVSFDVPGSVPLAPVLEWLHWVDEKFSPYREDSDVSRLARGEVSAAECVPQLAEVLDACSRLHEVSGGYFTAYPDGVLDPSGYVKGWAVEQAATMLADAGSDSHIVNGGGDVQCHGSQDAGEPWRVGVAHPLRPGALACVVAGSDFAVATSGIAERGTHIIDPVAGRPAAGLASITVVGPRLTLADAYATAAFAMGAAARDWTAALDGYEAFALTPDGGSWQTPGFGRYLA